jgi:hypothetical protein
MSVGLLDTKDEGMIILPDVDNHNLNLKGMFLFLSFVYVTTCIKYLLD